MRVPDWKARLVAHLERASRTPYAVGRHDCALFAFSAVEAVTGEDPAAEFRGHYSTIQGGLKLLRRAGHDDYLAFTAAHLPEIHPSAAAPADIAVVEDPSTGAMVLGVVQGEAVYVLGETGLGIVPRSAMRRAFRT